MEKLTITEDDGYCIKSSTRPTPFPPDDLDISIQEVGHIYLPTGVIYPETTALFCTLAWCAKGTLQIESDTDIMTVPEKHAFLMEYGSCFTTKAASEVCEAYYLLIDGKHCQKLLSDTQLWSGVFPFSEVPVTWLNFIADRVDIPDEYRLIANTGHSIFADLFRQAEQNAMDPLVWKACCFLQTHWQDPETNVEAVLNHLNLSRSTLSPRFKRQTNLTMKEYLNRIRFRHAKRLLDQATLPIASIAKQCGIPDPAHFSAWFRKQSGKSPRQMKRKMSEPTPSAETNPFSLSGT